ncbi:MAG: hypothetical protein KBA31_21165 [Alphaproteobacteria bacterium]|nr:hypothetical protein [Alphaproteobacteria bacterium]
MKQTAVRMLDDWCENGPARVDRETLRLFQECSQSLGMPAVFYRAVNASNFRRKAKALKAKRVAASKALVRALLKSRDHEDVGDYPAAIRAFEELKSQTNATFSLSIAQHEIERLQRQTSRRSGTI